jgi:hypothetical protein
MTIEREVAESSAVYAAWWNTRWGSFFADHNPRPPPDRTWAHHCLLFDWHLRIALAKGLMFMARKP